MFKRMFQTNKYLPFFAITMAIFLLVVVVGAIVLVCIYGSLSSAFHYLSRYVISDFGQVMYFTLSENPYTSNFPTMYLPLNFVVMLPFALICKSAPEFMELDNISIDPDGGYNYEELLEYNVGILYTWQFWVAVVLFFAITLTICGLLLYRMKKWEKGEFGYFYGGLCFSGFIMFGLFRGANIFLSLICILIFVSLYKSEKKLLKEISLIALAVSGVLKLYPLLFGLLLLKEKRFIDSVKVAIYFAILAVLPFLMYQNPFATFKEFLSNMFTFVGGEDRLGNTMNISISSLVCWLLNLFNTPEKVTSVISMTITVVAFGALLITALKSKSEFVTLMLTAIGVLIIPPVSYYYVCAFMVCAMLVIEKEFKDFSKPRKIYYLIFFAIMSFLPLSASMWYIPQCIMMAVIIIWEFVRVFSKEKIGVFPNEENTEEN